MVNSKVIVRKEMIFVVCVQVVLILVVVVVVTPVNTVVVVVIAVVIVLVVVVAVVIMVVTGRGSVGGGSGGGGSSGSICNTRTYCDRILITFEIVKTCDATNVSVLHCVTFQTHRELHCVFIFSLSSTRHDNTLL